MSLTVAPGGTGKSSLSICEAVALATGFDLLKNGLNEPLRVWYWNLEDALDELRRTVQGACLHHSIDQDDLDRRLFMDSGRERGLCLGQTSRSGFELIEAELHRFAKSLSEERIDVAIIDPFVSSHQLDENNNMQMDALMKRIGSIAARQNCAISLVHHTRKSGQDGKTSTESARGAKSLSDAARVVRVLNPMTEKEAAKFGIEDPAGHVSVRLDKQNMAENDRRHSWFKIQGVELGNGDDVGVVEFCSLSVVPLNLDLYQIKDIQEACTGTFRAADRQSGEWIGKAIASIAGLSLQMPSDRRAVIRIQETLIANGLLVEGEEFAKSRGRTRPIVRPGREGLADDV